MATNPSYGGSIVQYIISQQIWEELFSSNYSYLFPKIFKDKLEELCSSSRRADTTTTES
jgi:hypothetical protein